MRKTGAVQKQPFPQSDVVTKQVSAPTDGWDAISPLAAMDAKRAPILDNWVPRTGWVEFRQGFSAWSLSISATPVESLFVYRPPNAGQQMFAATDGKIIDVSTAGSFTPVVSGLTSNRWQYIQYTPANSITVLQLCNGIDPLYQYDGTNWTQAVITGLPGSGATSQIVNIHAQKRRIWYALVDSTVVAFMPTDAITGGIAGTLDLGSLWIKGGHIVAMSDWSSDGGNGPQNYMAFMSSRGQVSVYAGTDPTTAATWSYVATFNLAPPIGYRCMTQIGADVGLITLQGVLPISQALPFDPSADRSVAITARIQNAMAQAAAAAQFNFGWQLITFPAQQLLFLNVPISENTLQYQYVSNMLTGAWCRFTGWPANVFELYNEDLFFGDNNGNVFKAYNGGLDYDKSIQADMQCAYNWFDDPGRTKRMTMIQPLMVASGNISPSLSVDADFAVSTASAPLSILQGGAVWDAAIWDQSFWSGGVITVTNWDSADALGHALAVRMTVNIASSDVSNTPQGFDSARFDAGTFDANSTIGGIAPTLQVNSFNTVIELGGFV